MCQVLGSRVFAGQESTRNPNSSREHEARPARSLAWLSVRGLFAWVFTKGITSSRSTLAQFLGAAAIVPALQDCTRDRIVALKCSLLPQVDHVTETAACCQLRVRSKCRWCQSSRQLPGRSLEGRLSPTFATSSNRCLQARIPTSEGGWKSRRNSHQAPAACRKSCFWKVSRTADSLVSRATNTGVVQYEVLSRCW